MVTAFSVPILAVAADAVRDLEGHDALFGLWTVFTKCKESLPNGARLENITWRLWHCELKGPGLGHSSQKTKEIDAAEAIGPQEKSTYQPPTVSVSSTFFPAQTSPATPMQYSTSPEDAVHSFPEVHSPPSYSLSHPPRYPSEDTVRTVSSSRRTSSTSRAVGRIICDFLPTNRDPSVDQPSSVDRSTDVSSWSPKAPPTSYQSNPKTPLVACDALHPSTIGLPERSLVSFLPTPDLGVGEPEPSITRTATQSPSPLSNTGPEASSTLGLPPRLVVLRPTPNPTPQPTPPTSPLVTTTTTAMEGNRSLWLTPLRDQQGETPVDSSVAPCKSVISSLQKRACIPDHANIWTLPTSDFGQDYTDMRSVSSIASKSSECSHTTTSVAGASTTSASSTGYLFDEGEKATDRIGTTTGYTHLVGNLPLTTLRRLESLSTIHSISTDRGRKEAVSSSDVCDAMKDCSSGRVTAAEDEGEPEMTKKRKPPTGTRATFASKQRSKRNSAPVSLAPIRCPHVDQIPHHSLAVPNSTEHPTTPESTASNSVMNPEASDNRSSSQSHSWESSVKGSRSRSRERSGNPFADLSGIGTLGGYTIAAAYPPPNMTVRKQVAVGAGKAKVKMAFGRGKSKVVRRNSAGSALDLGTKEKDNGSNHGSGAKLERVKSEECQQSRLEDILEQPSLDQRMEPQERPQITAMHEEKVPSTAAVKQQSLATAHAVPKRYAELLEPFQSVKRQPRFNIGSNSDDGSGVASKSTGSGLSRSGGHSLGQRAGKMMEDNRSHTEARPHVVNGKTLDALLLEEQERQRRGDPKHHDTHAEPLQPPVPLHEPTLRQPKSRGGTKAVDGHHLEVPAPTSKTSSKTKCKSTPNLGSLDAVLAAKVRDSLGEPLLPKGRPVVVDTDSEYGTDTEGGTWSDEESPDETEPQKRGQTKAELALQQERESQEAQFHQQELLRQMYLQEQQHHPPHHQQHHGGRPTGVQRTHSSHYPAPNNARTNKGLGQRSRNHQIRELALHHAKLEQAAKEAQRQRDMIQKLPRESFQDLAKVRANSVGLLSQLLKQEPAPAAQTGGPRPLPPRRHGSTDEGRRRIPSISRVISPLRGPPLKLSKSSAALPVSSNVQVDSVSAKGAPSAAVTSSRLLGNTLTMMGSQSNRPKGPPQGQEMEEDSDSDLETGKIQISKSIAEQKLKALVEKRGVRQNQAVAQLRPWAGPSRAPPGDEDVPDWARVSQPDHQQVGQRHVNNNLHIPPHIRPPSVPIPLGHPYNLPLPAPPTTPRTTRRQMLSTELSESLRRNLLWERQVSKNNLAAMRRSASGGLNRHDGLGRLQPFTSIAPVVQLHAKGTIPLEQQEDPAKRDPAPLTDAEREEMRRHAIARNRSWANEFHYAGW